MCEWKEEQKESRKKAKAKAASKQITGMREKTRMEALKSCHF